MESGKIDLVPVNPKGLGKRNSRWLVMKRNKSRLWFVPFVAGFECPGVCELVFSERGNNGGSWYFQKGVKNSVKRELVTGTYGYIRLEFYHGSVKDKYFLVLFFPELFLNTNALSKIFFK